MASSRLQKIGTIFGRVTALLRSGAMKREDRPIWYDVYQAFPPLHEPTYSKPYPEKTEIRNIFYPEDVIRAKFHKKMFKSLPAENLYKEQTMDITRRVIALTYDNLENDKSLLEDEALDQAIERLTKEGAFARSSRQRSRKSEPVKQLTEEQDKIVTDYEEAIKEVSEKNINIKKLFKE